MGDPETYRASLLLAMAAFQALNDLPLDELIQSIDRADATGPIFDPTLYREKSAAMHEDRAVLVAARDFVAAVRSIRR